MIKINAKLLRNYKLYYSDQRMVSQKVALQKCKSFTIFAAEVVQKYRKVARNFAHYECKILVRILLK